MRKIVMTLAAALTLSATAMAQEVKKDTCKQAADRTVMIQKRTEATAKRYGLDEEQTKKLLELNTKYDGKVAGLMMRGDFRPMRGDMQARKHGMVMDSSMMKQRLAPDSVMRKRMNPAAGKRMNMAKSMKEYNEELRGIMTEEQYQKYEQDMQSRMKPAKRPQKADAAEQD